jgi:hypothetical protein
MRQCLIFMPPMLCHLSLHCTATLALKLNPRVPLWSNVVKQTSKLPRQRLHTAQAALVIASSLVVADAKDARTTMTVSATVTAIARLEAQSAPADVEVSLADVERGFIDVAEPLTLVIRSNSASGFAMDVMTVTPMLSSMVVHGLDSDQFLGADGGTLVQRWQRPQVVNLSLKFRLILAPGLTPGRYPWPLRVAVRPLDSA